MLFINLVVTF